jgi:hypothetical protein
MMVEPHAAALHIRNIREYIVFGHGHDSILQILGMGKGIGTDYAEVLQNAAACQSVEIRPCN